MQAKARNDAQRKKQEEEERLVYSATHMFFQRPGSHYHPSQSYNK